MKVYTDTNTLPAVVSALAKHFAVTFVVHDDRGGSGCWLVELDDEFHTRTLQQELWRLGVSIG